MKYTTIATVLFVAAASAYHPVSFGSNTTHNNVAEHGGPAHSPVPVGSSNTTHGNTTEHGGPSPKRVNGTYTPPSIKKVGVEKAQAYSAGDYYAAPTTTAESTMAFPTDTSKVSVTSVSLPPAMTDIAEKTVKNGASPMASAGGLVSVLAALASFSWLF